MSWKPKYNEVEELASKISRDYANLTSNGLKSIDVVIELSRKYNRAVGSIYRYLKYTNTQLTGKIDIDKRCES